MVGSSQSLSPAVLLGCYPCNASYAVPEILQLRHRLALHLCLELPMYENSVKVVDADARSRLISKSDDTTRNISITASQNTQSSSTTVRYRTKHSATQAAISSVI